MELISDFLLMTGAIAAGFYCYVLSKRLSALQNAEGGIGDAVKSLALQVDELHRSIENAKSVANESNHSIQSLTDRAENVAKRLELLVASMHDIPHTPVKEKVSEAPVFSTRMSKIGT